MTTKKKTRVVLSIEEDVWKEFQANLKEKGYPRGTASFLVQQKFEQINIEFDALGDSQQLDLVFPKN